MKEIIGVGKMIVNEEIIIFPYVLKEENNQLWLYFSAQIDAVLVDHDRVELSDVRGMDDNTFVCIIHPRFFLIKSIMLLTPDADYPTLLNFINTSWEPSDGSNGKDWKFGPVYDLDLEKDKKHKQAFAATCVEIVKLRNDTGMVKPPIKRGWFSWW